jgi:Leucine-rich repeat (LRR) protein
MDYRDYYSDDRDDLENCRFSGVTIGANEAVRIETDSSYTDLSGIIFVEFSGSSMHSLPRELFTTFPNLKKLEVTRNNIQEITPDLFSNAKNLEEIRLSLNDLTFLHKDAFKGETFQFSV